MKHF